MLNIIYPDLGADKKFRQKKVTRFTLIHVNSSCKPTEDFVMPIIVSNFYNGGRRTVKAYYTAAQLIIYAV